MIIFRLRSPLLIVTDPSINMLYGAARTRTRQIELSIRFFRRFIPVIVSSSAAPEIVASTLESVHTAPGAVLFPELYIEAAQRYKVQKPEIPVIILESRRFHSIIQESDTELYYIRPDTETDFYKAGISSAFFAGNMLNSRILVIYDLIPDNNFQAAFERGLDIMNFTGNVDYVDAQDEHILWENYSCAVLTGTASHFLVQNTITPIILFSWLDPDYTPFNVKIIFNDSPWVLAGDLFKVIKDSGSLSSSKITIQRRRINENLSILQRALRN